MEKRYRLIDVSYEVIEALLNFDYDQERFYYQSAVGIPNDFKIIRTIDHPSGRDILRLLVWSSTFSVIDEAEDVPLFDFKTQQIVRDGFDAMELGGREN